MLHEGGTGSGGKDETLLLEYEETSEAFSEEKELAVAVLNGGTETKTVAGSEKTKNFIATEMCYNVHCRLLGSQETARKHTIQRCFKHQKKQKLNWFSEADGQKKKHLFQHKPISII